MAQSNVSITLPEALKAAVTAANSAQVQADQSVSEAILEGMSM